MGTEQVWQSCMQVSAAGQQPQGEGPMAHCWHLQLSAEEVPRWVPGQPAMLVVRALLRLAEAAQLQCRQLRSASKIAQSTARC